MTHFSKNSPPLSSTRKLEMLSGSYPYVYQSENGVDLNLYCFYPENREPNQQSKLPLPTILFLHGGLWDTSLVTQFTPHAMHFASRGMITVVAEYRVGSAPEDAFNDLQMAMFWLRHNHQALGVNPNRVIVAGAAAGAHMALSLAMRKKLTIIEPYDSRPQAVIAISSFVHITSRSIDLRHAPNVKLPKKHNPMFNIRRKLPPSLMIHGKMDTIAPYYMVEDFVKYMRRKRNRCELIDFDACNHSFFNFNVSPEHFELTLNSMDSFVSDLGYIEKELYL